MPAPNRTVWAKSKTASIAATTFRRRTFLRVSFAKEAIACAVSVSVDSILSGFLGGFAGC